MESSQDLKIEPRALMEIADPNGDVILLVGTGSPVSIRASSTILTLASPVFAAMLGSSFWEGSQLSTRGTEPYELRLPEDDAETAIFFCLVLHYQRKIDDSISLSLFEKLALFCDKYNCASALSSWTNVWLHQFNDLPKDQANYERLLYTSYVFGIHEAFWGSSKAFLLNGLPGNCGVANRPDSLALGMALLPDRLLGMFDYAQPAQVCFPFD